MDLLKLSDDIKALNNKDAYLEIFKIIKECTKYKKSDKGVEFNLKSVDDDNLSKIIEIINKYNIMVFLPLEIIKEEGNEEHEDTASDASTNSYPCEVCAKEFKTSSSLKRHLKTVHSNRVDLS